MKQVVNYLGSEMNCPEYFKRWQFNYRFYQSLLQEVMMKLFNKMSNK